ncbi:MAG TPA: ABC transporter permease [Acidimicrobiales bacterium]|jgi:peptide/nickel transport system permease protein|nr:ABC transporter permease [Acidimicrobiales bacterium]
MRSFLSSLRHSPLLAIGIAIVMVLVVIAALAPVIAPYDPIAITGNSFETPSSAHLLGTNDAGADIFSRLVWGTRTSLAVAVFATTLVLAIGVLVGLVAGLRGGIIDTLLMRLVDVFLALPGLPLLIFVAALVGPSLGVSILMIGLALWPQTARIVRSQTLSLRTRGFVDSARGFGAGPLYVIRRHLLPALGPVVASNLVFVAGAAVTIEAGLAFIGLGDPIAVGWGTMLNRALENPQIYLGSLWLWWLLPAGLALTLAVLGFTFIGVGLEPRFNPRWSRSL